MKQEEISGDRYAAKLLFQYRVVVGGKNNVMRTCEERTLVFRAATARSALALAKRRGKAAQFRQRNSAGNSVHFELVGVLDLLRLGPECEKDEVWYDIKSLKQPMERAKNLIPPEKKLNAIAWASASKPLRRTRPKQRPAERQP